MVPSEQDDVLRPRLYSAEQVSLAANDIVETLQSNPGKGTVISRDLNEKRLHSKLSNSKVHGRLVSRR